MKFKPLTLVLSVLFILLQYQLWFATDGIAYTCQLQHSIKQLKIQNQSLSDKNSILVADVADLKHGNAAIEERARNELGMTKEGEVFYRVLQ